MKDILKNKKLSLLFKVIFIILLAFFMELTVFNFRHYLTLFNEAEKIKFTFSEDASDDSYIIESKEFKNLKDIKNIYFDINDISAQNIEKLELLGRDESNELYYSLGTVNYSSTFERSKYIYPAFEGKVKQIKLKVTTKELVTSKEIKVYINKKVPIIISKVRLFTMIIIGLLILIFRPSSKIYKKKLIDGDKTYIYLLGIICSSILIVFLISISSNPIHSLNEYNELTDAIVNKNSVSLGEYEYKVLSSLTNPYDANLRTAIYENQYNTSFDITYTKENLKKRIDTFLEKNKIEDTGTYKWDHVLYKNKYYVYYGVGPVISTYIPLKKLLGIEISNHDIIKIMLMLTICSFISLIYVICKKFYKDISVGLFYVLTFVGIASIGLISMMAKSTFYAIPYAYSLFLSLTGLFLIIHSYDSTKWYANLEILIAYFMFGFTSLTRPTYLIMLIVSIPFMINRIFKNKKISVKDEGITILACILPVIICAIGCMYYNYIRFDNIFEFGAKYQLTIKDVYHQEFNINKVWLAIKYFFLMPPTIIGKFPYVTYDAFTNNYLGCTVVEYMFGGALPTHLLLVFNFLIFKYRKSINKEIYIMSIICLVASVIEAIFACLEAGLVYRYFYDFMYLLVIPSIIVILEIIKGLDKKDKERFLKVILVISILTLLFEFLTLFSGQSTMSENGNPDLFYSFYYLLMP